MPVSFLPTCLSIKSSHKQAYIVELALGVFALEISS
jgi:hypothetical protein